MNRKELPESTIAEARRMREAGKYWNQIAEELGFHCQTIRRRIDPSFVRPKSVVYDAVGQADIGPRPPADVIAEREAYLKQQYSDSTGLLLGDPLPGRRATDRKNRSGARLALRPYNVFIMGAPSICVKSS